MDQKLQTILDFGGTSYHSLYADFAYQLFIVGLENKVARLENSIKILIDISKGN